MKKQSVYQASFLFILLSLWLIYGTSLALHAQTAPQKGDVNSDGVINIVDAMLIARQSVPVGAAEAADVNCSGAYDIIDALLVAQFSAQLIKQFPCPATPTSTPTQTASPVHLDNPFVDAKWYVNPDWSAKATAGGGAKIAQYNTAVWMNRIADITSGRGLAGHLDTALEQGANLFILVLYNVPGKDCRGNLAALPELEIADTMNIERYKTEFIAPIKTILQNPKYAGIRIVTIIEPYASAELVSSVDRYARCREAVNSGAYVQCIQYAINQLYTLQNIYFYMDIASSAWLGWTENFNGFANLFTNICKNTIAGLERIDGIISNISNYVPVEEPFLLDPNLKVGGVPIRSATFCDYNSHIAELPYVTDMYKALVAGGFPSRTGILIDTSRNGWGLPERPVRISSSSDVNTYVNESRIDRRAHRDNWCNQMAGLGARPTAAPLPLIDAFVWIKAPGESDGISQAGIIDPLDPSKRYVKMCDPNELNVYCVCSTTGAMANAPHAGNWHQPQFDNLLRYAYPPLK